MRVFFFILFILALIALDIYAFQAFRFLVKRRLGIIIYFVITAIIIGGLFYTISTGDRRNWSATTQFFIVAFVIMFVGKLVLIGTMLSEDIFRLFKGLYHKLSGETTSFSIQSRRKFVSQIALGLAAIPFAGILYGVFKGRYNFCLLYTSPSPRDRG